MAEAVTEFGADEESAAFGPGDPRPLFAAIANNMAAGVCVWDTDLRLVTWNAGYVKINSVAPRALRVGARLADILDDSAALHSDTRSGAEIEEMVSHAPDQSQMAETRQAYLSNEYLRNVIRNDLYDEKLTNRLIEIATDGGDAVINGYVAPTVEEAVADADEAAAEEAVIAEAEALDSNE